MDFKKLDLSDISVIAPYLNTVSHRACDCTLGGVLVWRDYFGSSYAIEKNTLIFKVGEGDDIVYAYPMGENIQHALTEIERDAKECGIPLVFYLCSEADMLKIKERYPNTKIEETRDSFDYLYDYEGLSFFKGKKYSGQRNHVNKFKRLYPDYTFEELDDSNIPECKAFLDRFLSLRERSEATDEEAKKIHELFDNFALYKRHGFFGGALKVGGKIVGFSVAENVRDTMFVHIEKADIAYDGVYQMLVCTFATHFATDGVIYINREDDAGNEGLRKSKLAYQPVELLPKFIVNV